MPKKKYQRINYWCDVKLKKLTEYDLIGILLRFGKSSGNINEMKEGLFNEIPRNELFHIHKRERIQEIFRDMGI